MPSLFHMAGRGHKKIITKPYVVLFISLLCALLVVLLSNVTLGQTTPQNDADFSWDSSEGSLGEKLLLIRAQDSFGNIAEKQVTINVTEPPSNSISNPRLWVDSSTNTINAGVDFTVAIKLDSPNENVAAVLVDGTLSDNLEIVALDDSNSVFNHIITPTDNNNPQRFRVTGLRTDSGYKGEAGEVVSLKLRAINGGPASITIEETTSQAIALKSGFPNILSAVDNNNVQVSEFSSVCIVAPLENTASRTDGSQNQDIKVEIFDAQSNQEVASIKASSDTTGTITLSDQAILGNVQNLTASLIRVTHPGYLPQELVTPNILRQDCHLLPDAVFGDFNSDSVINTDDIVRVFEFYRTGEDIELSKIYENRPTIIDLVELIDKYHQFNPTSNSPISNSALN